MLHEKLDSNTSAEIEEMVADSVFVDTLAEFNMAVRSLMKRTIKHQLDTEEVAGALFHDASYYWGEDVSDMPACQYQMLNVDSAVRMFLHTQRGCDVSETEPLLDKCFLDMLLTAIEDNQGHQSDIDSITRRVMQIMDTLESHTDYFKAFPNNHTIVIAPLDWDKTYYGGAVSTSQQVCHQVVVSSFVGDRLQDTCFEFLASLGSMFLFALTGTHDALPTDFSKVAEPLKNTSIGKEYNDTPRLLFIESFAMSLCTLPRFKQYDRYPEIPLSTKEKIYEYMMQQARSKN